MKQYIWNLFVAFDQFINTIAAGKPDCTVSSCSYIYSKVDRFWYFMQGIINFAFYPMDGEDHCKQAYENDNETYSRGGIFRKSTIFLIVVPFCILLSLISWTIYGLVKLKRIVSC